MKQEHLTELKQGKNDSTDLSGSSKLRKKPLGANHRIAFLIAVLAPILAVLFIFARRELGLKTGHIPKDLITINSEQANERIRGEISSGQKVTVHFEIWLATYTDGVPSKGKQVESTRQSGTPFTFTLGSGQVFQGWDKAIAPMQLGEKRTVYIPAEEAYGKDGIRGKIPPNSGLILEVEVLEKSQSNF